MGAISEMKRWSNQTTTQQAGPLRIMLDNLSLAELDGYIELLLHCSKIIALSLSPFSLYLNFNVTPKIFHIPIFPPQDVEKKR